MSPNRSRAITVVWLDLMHARVFQVSEERMQRDRVLLSETYYQEVAELLKGSSQIILLGSSGARQLLMDYLKSERPELAKKVVSSEPMLEASDSSIAETAFKYLFKSKRS